MIIIDKDGNAALFTPPVFENKKENKGYWF